MDAIIKALDKVEEGISNNRATMAELSDRMLSLEQKGAMRPHEGALVASPEIITGPMLIKSATDMRSHFRDAGAPTVSVTDFLRGVAGMKTSELAIKSLSAGTDTAGGFAVPRNTAGQIMAALVPNSALMQAGCPVIPLPEGKSWTTAIVNAIPTAAWRAENGAVVESDPTFRAVVSTPQSLSFRFKVSRELLADAVNMETVLREVIAQALAKELDRAGLRGTGTAPQPRGLLNTSGVLTVDQGTNGTAGPAYSTIMAVLDDILQLDAPMPTAAIMSPRSLVRLGMSVDSTGQPLRRPDMLTAMQLVSSSQIPNNLTAGTSTDCTELYIGDFSRMAIMLREGMSIQLLNELYAETGQVGFVGHVRADISVFYPQAFAIVTGLR